MLRNLELSLKMGKSKKADRKANGGKAKYLHSASAIKTYTQQCRQYGDWLREQGLGHCSIEQAKEKAVDYIAAKYPNSAHSQQTARAAIARGLGCDSRELGRCQKRRAKNIRRSRGVEKDRGRRQKAIEQKYPEAVAFCRASGLRREGVRQLKKENIRDTGSAIYVTVTEKGGLKRTVSLLPDLAAWAYIRRRCKECGYGVPLIDTKQLPSHADIHSYREDFALRLYEHCIEERIHLTGKYYTPRDGEHAALDKGVLSAVNKALGHGDDRCYTVYYNYIKPAFMRRTQQDGAGEYLQ